MGFTEKVLLLMISAVSGILLPTSLDFLNSLKLSVYKRVLLVLAVVYLTFATVGQRGIIYPIDSTISIGRLTELLATAIWYIPIIALLVYGVKRILSKAYINNYELECKETKRLSVCNIVILTIILITPMLIMLITFNPGIVSYDTNLCLSIYAHDLRPMIDNQPFFYIVGLLLIVIIVEILNKKALSGTAILCIPMLGQIFSIFLSTGWADFRYYWSINLLSLMSIMYIFCNSCQNTEGEYHAKH